MPNSDIRIAQQARKLQSNMHICGYCELITVSARAKELDKYVALGRRTPTGYIPILSIPNNLSRQTAFENPDKYIGAYIKKVSDECTCDKV